MSAIKYMGTDDGGPGGVLLHVHSNTAELAHTNVEERVARWAVIGGEDAHP